MGCSGSTQATKKPKTRAQAKKENSKQLKQKPKGGAGQAATRQDINNNFTSASKPYTESTPSGVNNNAALVSEKRSIPVINAGQTNQIKGKLSHL